MESAGMVDRVSTGSDSWAPKHHLRGAPPEDKKKSKQNLSTWNDAN